MTEWIFYQFDVDKPEVDLSPTEDNRLPLEFRVSTNICYLLSRYGNIPSEPIEVDNGDSCEADSSMSYQGLELDPYVLEDDSELVVGQFPFNPDEGFIVSPGVHAVSHLDEDDMPIMNLVVFDSTMICDGPYVVDHAGDPLPLTMLHELVAATQILINWCEGSDIAPHDPPLPTHELPVRVSEPDFETVIAGF